MDEYVIISNGIRIGNFGYNKDAALQALMQFVREGYVTTLENWTRN